MTTVPGSFSYAYYFGNTPSGTPSATAPSVLGIYTVVATLTSSDPNYGTSTGQTTFAITGDVTISVTSSSDTPTYAATVAYAQLLSAEFKNVTLRDALNAANNSGSGTSSSFVIELQANTTYDLTQVDNDWYGPDALPAIASTVTIDGNGATSSATTTTGLPSFRLFYVSGGLSGLTAGSLTLNDLTLQGGVAQGGSGGGGGGLGAGGAIFNQGTLSLNGVTVSDNTAQGGDGGFGGGTGGGMGSGDRFGGNFPSGVYGGQGAAGDATSGGVGGGFEANGPGGGNGGGESRAGGDQSTAQAVISASAAQLWRLRRGRGRRRRWRWRTAEDLGEIPAAAEVVAAAASAAAAVPAALTPPDTERRRRCGRSGALAALAAGVATASAAAAGGFGAGAAGDDMYFYLGDLYGQYGFALGAGGGGGGFGGAIFSMGGTVTLTNSTLVGNTAQGGNSYFPTNGIAGGGGSGFGGAIFNLDGTLNLIFGTIADNTVTAGTGHGNGQAAGGAVYNLAYDVGIGAVTATATINDSILSNTTGGSDLVNNSATVTFVNNNIVQTSTGTLSGKTPLTADPRLGPLQDNGGPTETMAITTSSPAYRKGTAIAGITTDQRGKIRSTTTAPSLGAYDPDAKIAPTVTVSDAGGTYKGTSFAATGKAVGTDGTTPVSGTFSYAYYVGSSASGTSSATAPSNAGTYTVVATFTSTNSNYATATPRPPSPSTRPTPRSWSRPTP